MRTYIFSEGASPKRGYDTRVTVYRVIKNQPILIGRSDHSRASWKGAHGEAVTMLHTSGREKYAIDRDGNVNRYELRGELGACEKYDGKPGNYVRLFEVSL